MPFVAECPSCGQRLKVPDELAGKKVRCSKCQATFAADGGITESPRASRPERAEREERDDAYEERPRRSSRSSRRGDDDDYDDDRGERRRRGAPGRGGMLLTFGILSIAMSLMSLVSVFLCNMFLPIVGTVGGFIFVILGLVFGIMAWAMGGSDLKQIRAGRISREAEGTTKGGYITGIIGTILNALQIVCSCIMIILAVAGVAILAGAAGAAAKQQQNQQFPPPGPPPGFPRRAPLLPPARLHAPWLPAGLAAPGAVADW